MKYSLLPIFILVGSVPAQVHAEETFAEREFAAKKQVFGIRQPWQMTTPYADSLPPQQRKVIIDGSPWEIQTGIEPHVDMGKQSERVKLQSNKCRDGSSQTKLPPSAATLIQQALAKLTANPPDVETAKKLLRQSVLIRPDSGLEHELSFLDARKHNVQLQLKRLPDDATYLCRYLRFRQRLGDWQEYQKERYGFDPQSGFIAPPSSTPAAIWSQYTIPQELEHFSPYFDANVDYVPRIFQLQ